MSLFAAARPQLLSDAKPPKPSMFPLPHEHEEVCLASFEREVGGGGRSGPKIVTAIMPGGGCARPARPHLATAWALVPGSRVLGFNVGPWV